jgi:hypothetical protein
LTSGSFVHVVFVFALAALAFALGALALRGPE